jgi:copper resistance protein B
VPGSVRPKPGCACYEITRQFAPYLGVVHERRFGRSADHARADGEGPRDTRWVAGLRIWF